MRVHTYKISSLLEIFVWHMIPHISSSSISGGRNILSIVKHFWAIRTFSPYALLACLMKYYYFFDSFSASSLGHLSPTLLVSKSGPFNSLFIQYFDYSFYNDMLIIIFLFHIYSIKWSSNLFSSSLIWENDELNVLS